MSKPMVHAQNSARKHGGVPEDYLKLHEAMDFSKAAYGKVTHRALTHHTLGPHFMEMIFGVQIQNSAGAFVGVRDLAEEHIMEDLGCLPTVEMWLGRIPLQPWMGGAKRRPFVRVEEESEGSDA